MVLGWRYLTENYERFSDGDELQVGDVTAPPDRSDSFPGQGARSLIPVPHCHGVMDPGIQHGLHPLLAADVGVTRVAVDRVTSIVARALGAGPVNRRDRRRR